MLLHRNACVNKVSRNLDVLIFSYTVKKIIKILFNNNKQLNYYNKIEDTMGEKIRQMERNTKKIRIIENKLTE